MKNELKEKTIKRLEELKERLSGQTYEENYRDLVNTLIDYDNEAQDTLYLYDSMRETVEFVDDEIMEYLIKDCDNDIDRLRCFIGDTHSDYIYKLDGYGNLENVTDDDFEHCIDNAIEQLKEAQ